MIPPQRYYLVVEDAKLANLLATAAGKFQQMLQGPEGAISLCTLLHRINYGVGLMNGNQLRTILDANAYEGMVTTVVADILMASVINSFLENQNGESDDGQQDTEADPGDDGSD